jgi:hypothetical protein
MLSELNAEMAEMLISPTAWGLNHAKTSPALTTTMSPESWDVGGNLRSGHATGT